VLQSALVIRQEVELRTIQSLGVAFALIAASVIPAVAGPVCLRTYFIQETKIVDAKTIDFKMRDGTVYRNALRTPCPGLRFHGFVYVTRMDEICDNLQSIRVLESHEVCLLGAFTKLPPAPARPK
jgi:hypothetical protein